MEQITEDRLKAAALAEYGNALEEAWPDMMENYKQALEAHNEEKKDKKFSFNTPATIQITCIDPSTFNVGVNIATKVRKVFSADSDVKATEDMVDDMEKADGKGEGKPKRGGKGKGDRPAVGH